MRKQRSTTARLVFFLNFRSSSIHGFIRFFQAFKTDSITLKPAAYNEAPYKLSLSCHLIPGPFIKAEEKTTEQVEEMVEYDLDEEVKNLFYLLLFSYYDLALTKALDIYFVFYLRLGMLRHI